MINYLERVYKVLIDVYKNKAFSQVTLNEVLETGFSEDSPLITKIVYGVLDNDIYLDYVIKCLTSKKPKNAIMPILKSAIYVLKFLSSIPSYAIINNAVNLTKKLKKTELAGFVNATLKSAVNFDIKEHLPKDELEKLSILTSYPMWYVESVVKQYGQQLGETILRYRSTGRTHARINSLRTTEAEFEKQLKQNNVSFEKSKVVGGYYVSHSKLKTIKKLEGSYANQSISSMAVCQALGVDKENATVLDCCSAPGGKGVYIAEKNPSAKVVCAELYDHRAKLITAYANRMSVKNIEVTTQDMSVFNDEFENKFDYVLCDVPCSGFGVVNDKPDIKLFRTKQDILELNKIQFAILQNCSRYVKEGGVLLYSTCTLLGEENMQVVQKFLNENKDFKTVPFKLEFEPALKKGDCVQLLTALDDMPSFFIAKLVKS